MATASVGVSASAHGGISNQRIDDGSPLVFGSDSSHEKKSFMNFNSNRMNIGDQKMRKSRKMLEKEYKRISGAESTN